MLDLERLRRAAAKVAFGTVAGEQATVLGALRAALAERSGSAAPAGSGAPSGNAGSRAPDVPPPDRPTSRTLGSPRAVLDAPSADGPAVSEANLVIGLFARPRSLAAAIIAAEILAKPVALRDR